MTVIQPFSAARSQPVGRVRTNDDTRSFVIHHGDDLILVCTAAGGHNGRAAATDLVDSVLSGIEPVDLVQDLLIAVRDILRDALASPRSASAFGRPDLDAAVRWTGARLDDLIRTHAYAMGSALRSLWSQGGGRLTWPGATGVLP